MKCCLLPMNLLFLYCPKILLTMKNVMLPLLIMVFLISCTNQDDFLDSIAVDDEEIVVDDTSDDDQSDDDQNDDPPVDDSQSDGRVLAFPTAEGAGADASGGRGGKVLHVTNLEWNNNPGSFKWALEQPFPRIIVFDVSGTISVSPFYGLTGQQYSDLTIAGQTAPEGGITIEHAWFSFKNLSNVIIRYVRWVQVGAFVSPPINSTSLDFDVTGNGIIDHCSFRYSWNSVALASRNRLSHTAPHEGVSVQRNIFSECKTGVLLGPQPSSEADITRGDDYSFHKNLFTHISHRFSNVTGNGNFELVNNVVYNYSARLSTFFNNSKTNLIGNTYKRGPVGPLGIPNLIGDYLVVNGGNNTPTLYTDDNAIINGASSVTDESSWSGFMNLWQFNDAGVSIQSNPASESVYRSLTMLSQAPDVPITILSREAAYDDVLNNVGANAYLNGDGSTGFYLDANDTTYINDVINGTCVNCKGSRYSDKTNRGDLYYPILPQNVRPQDYDTDGDGIPNAWEDNNGLNSNDPTDANGDIDGDGYTNIEEFLNRVDF